jgi:uncharacterized membrane protein
VTNQTFDALAFESLIDRLMLVGVRTSEVCLIVGAFLWLIDPGGALAAWLLRVGLIALMSVPVLRIALTVVEALRLKDALFAAATISVAAVLALSIAYAFLVS